MSSYIALGVVGCEIPSEYGAINFNYFNLDITGDANGGNSNYADSVTVTPTDIGFTFTGSRVTGASGGQTGFGAAPNGSATLAIFYFANANPLASITGVTAAVSNLRSDNAPSGQVTSGSASKRIRTGIDQGNASERFNQLAGTTLAESTNWQSLNFSGLVDIDVASDSDTLVWGPVQNLRVRDLVTIINSPTGNGRSGLSSFANTTFVITSIPEPGTLGLLGIGLAGLMFGAKRFRRS